MHVGTDVIRIDVETARDMIARGQGTLVCAYDDEEKCRRNLLLGATPIARFRETLHDAREQIILYCA